MNKCLYVRVCVYQGWGLLNQFSPFRYFPHFPLLSKQTLAIEYRVYIWQVSPQLSCGDTCQIWMWFRESNRYFCKIENFAYGEISERSFSNPHPWTRVNNATQMMQTYTSGSFSNRWLNSNRISLESLESKLHQYMFSVTNLILSIFYETYRTIVLHIVPSLLMTRRQRTSNVITHLLLNVSGWLELCHVAVALATCIARPSATTIYTRCTSVLVAYRGGVY